MFLFLTHSTYFLVSKRPGGMVSLQARTSASGTGTRKAIWKWREDLRNKTPNTPHVFCANFFNEHLTVVQSNWLGLLPSSAGVGSVHRAPLRPSSQAPADMLTGGATVQSKRQANGSEWTEGKGRLQSSSSLSCASLSSRLWSETVPLSRSKPFLGNWGPESPITREKRKQSCDLGTRTQMGGVLGEAARDPMGE